MTDKPSAAELADMLEVQTQADAVLGAYIKKKDARRIAALLRAGDKMCQKRGVYSDMLMAAEDWMRASSG